MLHQLTITCDYPAQLIGFHMQNCTDNTELAFNARVPIEDSDEAVYAWGTPEDASDVQHSHSDAGSCIYRFETPLPPLEWLTASILPAVNIYINIILILYSLASSTFNLLASRSATATNTFSTPLDTSRHSRYAKIEFLLVFLQRVFPHRSRKSLFKITKINFLQFF